VELDDSLFHVRRSGPHERRITGVERDLARNAETPPVSVRGVLSAGTWRRARELRGPELGLRFGRSIASPSLRGIARDAAHVARRIAG
jgi:hypothetical protein